MNNNPLPMSREEFMLLVLASASQRGRNYVAVNRELLEKLAELHGRVCRSLGSDAHHRYRPLTANSLRLALDDLMLKGLVTPEYGRGVLNGITLRFHPSDADRLLADNPAAAEIVSGTSGLPALQKPRSAWSLA